MMMMSTDIKLFSYCIEDSVAEPHHFRKSYPGPHQGEKTDPDPHKT
jgi:hypothetical protein